MTNSLKLSDAIHLSWTNISQHKSRSLIIILTISILFGLLIGVSFILCGLENSLLDVASAKTSGAFYVESYYMNTSQSTSNQKVLARLEKYHGESIGTIKNYNFNSANAQLPFAGMLFRVVSSSAVAPFLDIDLAKIPSDKIPILAPEDGFTFDEEVTSHVWLEEQVSDKYYIAGYLPVMQTGDQPYNGTFEPGYSTPSTPTIPGGFNLLNLILGNVLAGPTARSLSSSPIFIDDGSGKVDAYIKNLLDLQAETIGEDYYGPTSPLLPNTSSPNSPTPAT